MTVTQCNSAFTLPPSSLIHAVPLVLFSLFNLSVFNHQGRLAGVGGEDLPTIVVVAHYDSFGVAPVCSLLLFFQQINPLKSYRKLSS